MLVATCATHSWIPLNDWRLRQQTAEWLSTAAPKQTGTRIPCELDLVVIALLNALAFYLAAVWHYLVCNLYMNKYVRSYFGLFLIFLTYKRTHLRFLLTYFDFRERIGKDILCKLWYEGKHFYAKNKISLQYFIHCINITLSSKLRLA